MSHLQAIARVVPAADQWQIKCEALTSPFQVPDDPSFKAYANCEITRGCESRSNAELEQLLVIGQSYCRSFFKLVSVAACGAREQVVRDFSQVDLETTLDGIVALLTGYAPPAALNELVPADLSGLARHTLSLGMNETELARLLHLPLAHLRWLQITAEWDQYHYRDCPSVLVALTKLRDPTTTCSSYQFRAMPRHEKITLIQWLATLTPAECVGLGMRLG